MTGILLNWLNEAEKTFCWESQKKNIVFLKAIDYHQIFPCLRTEIVMQFNLDISCNLSEL